MIVSCKAAELWRCKCSRQWNCLCSLLFVSHRRAKVGASHLAACESGDAAPLRQLVAIVCAKEELATEVLNQGGLSVFLGALRAENAAAELASTGLCAFLQHPRRRAEVVELLSKDWQTYGPRLMPALLRALVSDGPPARASMALLLWLLEEVEGAPGAFHAAAMRQEADDGAPGYRQLAATAHGAAALRRAQQKAPVALRESMCEAVDAEVHGGFMEDLLKEESSHEVLSILTASCATPQAACTELQRQQATQIKEEKKFTEMLQGKLRQSHRALQAMAPLVKLGDPDLERTLASILQNGWESAHWPEGQTLLHFLCEHSEDPRAVQLVSELCPDLEARDEKGLRAMDYAMQNPSSEVADQLLKVSRARACQSFGPLEDDVYGQNLEVIQEHEPPSAVSISDPKLSEIKQSVVLGKDGETEHGTIGALFVLRTQLSAALRENEALKDKVGELELLRTRLAILSEERGPVAATGPLLPAEIAEKRERGIEIQEVSSLQRVSDSAIRGDVAGSDNISASASECEPVPEPPASVAASSPDASPTPREVPTEAASPKLLAPPRGKAKGKGKGPQLPSPSPSPSEGSSAASDIGDATPTPSSSKGKGKSKGPPPAPGGRPAGAETGEKGKGKGKGKAAVEPTKPTVKPMQDLKTLPWTRYVVGAQLQQGTIWDKVNFVYDEDHIMESLPLEEIEKRFGKSAGLQKVAKAEVKESKKPKTVKIDSITQQQRFQIEVSLRTLPVSLNNGAKAAQALKELDRSAITAEALQTLRRFLCPSEEQEMELSSKRQAVEVERSPEDPFVWDPVEQFMEDLAQVRGCAMRLSCWGFLYNLPDRLSQLQDNLQRFEKMVRCFLTSVEIPFLLSLVLAFGNYLNGGKNEKRLGQADGFHVELLGRPGGLDVVNDAQGCNLRQLIFTVYCEKHQGRAEQLLRELAPMFGLVQRRLGKDAQGVPQIRKSVRVQIEELDKQLMQLKSEFSARHQELKDGLKQISDPADKFVVEVPPEFERARQQVEDLVRQKDTVVQQFKLVLANFKAETYRGDSVIVDGQVKDGNPKEEMTSEVWCKIWDDFFVPGERVLTFDEKRQKELIEPHFCKDSPLTVESLAILWGLPSASLSSAQRPRAKAARRRTTA